MPRYLVPVILILISALVSLFYPRRNLMQEESIELKTKIENPSGGIYNVRWQTLQKLDYRKNLITDEELKKFINSRVKIPGFAVPLSDNLQAVREFLLVPNQMACIHVPPPPPNLIVFVRLKEAVKIDSLAGPIWTQGILRLKPLQSIYGSSSYELEDVSVEPYVY